MCSPDEANFESSAPLREKKMNWFAFESGLKWSHFSRNCFTGHRWRKRNQIISSKKQKPLPAMLKLLHRRNQFHRQNHFNRFDNAFLSSKSSKILCECVISFWFYQACFPGKTHLFRLFHQAVFLEGAAFQLFFRSSMEFWFLDGQSSEASKWISTSF